jgi:hypothetical protein
MGTVRLSPFSVRGSGFTVQGSEFGGRAFELPASELICAICGLRSAFTVQGLAGATMTAVQIWNIPS